MIDLKIEIDNHRLNPEGNFPLYTILYKELSIGGTGNVAHILTTLDKTFNVVGVVGGDIYGQFIKNKYKNVQFNGFNTILKKRYYLENKYIFRIDDEQKYSALENVNDEILIVSDYAKGTVSEKLFENKKRIFINGKPKNFNIYKNIEWLQINKLEAKLMSGLEDPDKACKKIAELKNCNVIVTLGKDGSLVCENGMLNKYTFSKEGVTGDVCCCGDIFFSIFSYMKLKNHSTEEAIKVASKYSAENVKHIGIYLDWLKDFKY